MGLGKKDPLFLGNYTLRKETSWNNQQSKRMLQYVSSDLSAARTSGKPSLTLIISSPVSCLALRRSTDHSRKHHSWIILLISGGDAPLTSPLDLRTFLGWKWKRPTGQPERGHRTSQDGNVTFLFVRFSETTYHPSAAHASTSGTDALPTFSVQVFLSLLQDWVTA